MGKVVPSVARFPKAHRLRCHGSGVGARRLLRYRGDGRDRPRPVLFGSGSLLHAPVFPGVKAKLEAAWAKKSAHPDH